MIIPWLVWLKKSLKLSRNTTGIIKLPMLAGMKHYKCMVNLKDFPFNGVLFGLVKQMTPCYQPTEVSGHKKV